MKILLISIGEVKQQELKALCKDYTNRLKKLCRFEQLVLKENTTEKELEQKLSNYNTIFILDEYAKTSTSEELSALLTKKAENGETIVCVLGPAEGFSKAFKQKYQRLSLSPMTFPHELAQVLLLEQLYRSEMIRQGRSYHKV